MTTKREEWRDQRGAVFFPDEDGMKVKVELWLQAITSINEITNDFEVRLRFLNPGNWQFRDGHLHYGRVA